MVNGAGYRRLPDAKMTGQRANRLWLTGIDTDEQHRHLPKAEVVRLVANEFPEAIKQA